MLISIVFLSEGHEITVELSEIDLVNTTVVSLKEQVQELFTAEYFPINYDVKSLPIIYESKIVDDSVILATLITNVHLPEVKLFIIDMPHECNEEFAQHTSDVEAHCTNPEYDIKSICSAVRWIDESSSKSNTSHINQLSAIVSDYVELDRLHQALHGCPLSPQISGNTPERPNVVNTVISEDFQWFNLRVLVSVIARFIVSFLIFTRGKVMPLTPQKVILSFLFIVFTYLYEIGYYSKLAEILLQSPISTQADAETLRQTLTRIYNSHGTLPRQPGHINDIYSLCASFLLSIIPTWTPRAYEENMPLVPEEVPPPVAARPVEERFI